MMTPYKPLELSQCDVAVLEELIFSKRLFSLSKENSSEKIRFVAPPVSTDAAAGFSLSLKADQQKIHLTLKPTLESSFTKCLSGFGGVEAIPKEFLTAVTAYCSRKIINSLETFLQVPIFLNEEAENNSDVPEEKTIYFEIINNNAVVEVQGQIKLSLLLLKKLLSMAAQIPQAERSDLNDCALQGEFLIGAAKVPWSQWSNLRPGDLVFFEEPSACSTGEGFFHLKNGQKISLSFDIKELQPLIRPLEQVAFSAPADSSLVVKNQNTQEQELASLEKLVTMELTFSASTLSLTLDEITDLFKTKKLTHSPNLNHPLKILAQGKPVGAGELIELHGQHAIFITQLQNAS